LDASHTDLKVTLIGFVGGAGGDALQMMTLADGMQRLGATVEILVANTPESREFVHRCAAIGVPARCTDLIQVPLTGSRQRMLSLVRLLRAIDSDVIHIHTGHSCPPRMMMLALLLSRRRHVVVTSHNPYLFIDPEGMTARLWSLTAKRRLHAVVSPSEHGTRSQLQCGIPERVAVTIHNAVDTDRFATGDARGPRQSLGLDTATPIVLFSSRLDSQKRPLDAVRIFARVAATHPTAVLVFVGSGELEEAIRSEAQRLEIEHRLKLTGYQMDVPDWLAAATVWLFPTDRENFSMALLEALAAGCVILASNCPGNDEILVDGSNALTFAVGDIDTAARGLERLLDDQALRTRLRDGARATSREHSLGQMVERYRQVYDPTGL
jgi:glycosyltransferase involved in cell wall biosynthesis